jgi:hypothetical protein
MLGQDLWTDDTHDSSMSKHLSSVCEIAINS